MATDIAIFRINYKSDFIITLESDAGWATPFCIKFWTGDPSRSYFVGWDGKDFINCKVDETDANKLIVLFDDHNLPIGQLKMQMAWHTTIADFPYARFDEVMNQMDVVTTIEGEEKHVELAFEGETAPEIAFSLPAYANEAQRIANEQQRIANEEARIANEQQRVENEQARIDAEQERERACAEAVEGAENVDAQLDGTILTVTNRDGESTSRDVQGPQGVPGPQGVQGPQGVPGPQGERGVDGRSAYEIAVEGGYTGTEAEFDSNLAKYAEMGGVLLGIDTVPTFEELNATGEDILSGTYCMYDGKFYRFLVDHTAGAPWNDNEVIETDLFREISEMMKADYEEVVIILQTETATPLENVEVVVTVEGEGAPRNLITDQYGRCTTNIEKGLEYTVAPAAVPNYYPVDPIVRRAALATRYIEVTYIEDDTLTREAVKITLSYADPTLTKATWVRVSYGGENYQLAVNSETNVAETTVPLGMQYTITFEDIDGYKTPSPQTYTAQLHGTRNINVRYNAPVSGLNWLMKDGAERELNDVTNAERLNGDIFGLIVQTSDLMAAGCSFVIPLEYLLTQGATGTGQWLSTNETVPQLQYFGSHAAALADMNGDANCAGIRQYIAEKAEQGISRTSSMVAGCWNRVGGAPTFKDTVNYEAEEYVVYRNMLHQFLVAHTAGPWVDGETDDMYGFIMPDGVVRRCFQPSYGQIYAFRLLRDQVNDLTLDIFGIGTCNVKSGYWWSSTQANATNGVLMNSGNFGSNTKNINYTLLPVLAY